MTYLSSVSINGLELNDSINYLCPFPTGMDDLATSTPRLQQLEFGPPVYTGQNWAEKTITIIINIMPPPGDWNYSDFEAKLDTLKRAFDTKYTYLSTLRLQRSFWATGRTIMGVAKSFAVNRLQRQVTVQFVVPDATWLDESVQSKNFLLNSTGTDMIITSKGTVETFPTFNISWNISKLAVNPNGSFYNYQIPVSITNYAQQTVQRFPVELSGYSPPPTFSLVSTTGSIPAQTVSVRVSALRYALDGSGAETSAASARQVSVGAGSGVIVNFNPFPDAIQYNIFAGPAGSETFQSTVLQPAQVVQPDGQLRTPLTVSTTITTLTTGGRAAPNTNSTGWNHAALVAAGQAKADGSDVRVLIGGVPSPSILVGNNTNQARIWVLLDLGASETKNIYIQYGNQNPSNTPVQPSGTTSAVPVTGAITPVPLAEAIAPFPAGDLPMIDTTNSNNYSWTWAGQFYDYINILRPGSWQPVSSIGVGYGWKQDVNIVKRGALTNYSQPTRLSNGSFTNGLSGWSTSGSVAVDAVNPRFGSQDNYSALLTGAASITQSVPVTPGLEYAVQAYMYSNTAGATTFTITDPANPGSPLVSFVGAGVGSYDDIFLNSTNALPLTFIAPGGGNINVTVNQTSGVGRLDDVSIYLFTDTSTRTPLIDDATDLASCLGLLHDASGINNRETPLNGWELSHPAGVTSVTHYGITAMAGSDYRNDNVLRLMAEDQSRAPAVIWGQEYLTYVGAVQYATQASPRVDIINPSRARVRFEINVSTQFDPLNLDGTFVAIQGITTNFNTQYAVGLSYGPVQAIYDLNCVIAQNTPNDGDMLYIQTNLEQKSSLRVDIKNKMVWHIDSAGVQTLRTSAISIDSLRPYWMQIHPGINRITYYEDSFGQILMNIIWSDAYN